MNEKFQRVVYLFRKAFAKELTSEEQQEFDLLMENSCWKRVYLDLADDTYLEDELGKYFGFSSEKAFRAFSSKVLKNKYNRHNFALVYRSIAVAAVILSGIVLWLWFDRYANEKEHTEIVNVSSVSVTQLKLADGRLVEMGMDKSEKIEAGISAKIYYDSGNLVYISTDTIVEQLEYNELVVPIGAECQVTLEDGSRVWINANSRLKYPIRFHRERREILLEGEAYFEVKKDRRPFVVHSKSGDVRVLGTSFGITAYPTEEMLTTLVDGKVAFVREQGDSLVLHPGEQVVVPVAGEVEIRQVNVEEYVGWKDGLYVFKERTLESIMNMLQRWYGVDVFYQSPSLKEVQFTGNVKRYDSIESFLQLLKETGELMYKINGKTVILYK